MLGRSLDAALGGGFFQWFHLERYEVPRPLTGGTTWHGFRPEGDVFRDQVTVNFETDAAGCIADAKLCLDRAFVEHPKHGSFARDITANFLRWLLPQDEQDAIREFLAELGDLGPNVIRLGNVPVAASPGAPTPLYRAYLGRSKDAERTLPGKTLRLVNLQARDGPRDPQHDWIWVRVYRD